MGKGSSIKVKKELDYKGNFFVNIEYYFNYENRGEEIMVFLPSQYDQKLTVLPVQN
jgi:hypothetical protein